MMEEVPAVVRHRGLEILQQRKSEPVSIVNFTPSGGGCINHGGRLFTTAGDYFVKWNSAVQYPGMFAAEAKGLELLRQTHILTIPEFIGRYEDEEYQFLLLEFVQEKTKSKMYWQDLGIKLAAVHRISSAAFGLDHDNYIGSLRQLNKPSSSWVDFFIASRIQVQLDIGLTSGAIDPRTAKDFEKLYRKLPDLLHDERPSLVHGDLWSGNLMTDSEGNPCLIDPAVYYGHRETDLAMTGLFGGFHPAFYDSYNNAFPLAPGYLERCDIYNLYPLLVHVNLFGGGYLRQINSILVRYI